jgi:hypothetical protein
MAEGDEELHRCAMVRLSLGDEHESEDLKRPARLTAALAAWIGSRDDGELRRAFRRAGMELTERLPDHHYVHEYYGRGAGKLLSGMDDKEFLSLASKVREEGRTYLYFNRLFTLYQAVGNVARRFPSEQLRFLEAGTFRGGSTSFLAGAAQRLASGRVSLTAIDTFAGHPEQDLPAGAEGAHSVDKFTETSVEEVEDYLSEFPFVDVIAGRVQDIAPGLVGELHLMHLDVDLYAPTRFGLDFASERLGIGGVVIVDDYRATTCPGVTQAVDEFAQREGGRFLALGLDTGQCLLVRTG